MKMHEGAKHAQSPAESAEFIRPWLPVQIPSDALESRLIKSG